MGLFSRRPAASKTTTSNTNDDAFRVRLLTRMTAVPGDPAWNLAVARNAAEHITGTDPKTGKKQ